ncbi:MULTISPECIES: RNA 2',3'-cyclic phosphodiesterase [Streptomyces]|uniref:RNA 2',3'-cyclic phosphodiesterase n=1 Tax=Streptomyces TaxID=1883 RepID=UPI0005BCBB0D|nr:MULTISPECIES: RNA 2',3'-cyclic phosphodiesterase [unclassified Streptomyces]MCM1944921.1 RNA 2',3'-cyclic phosphodiesterase [Streptomyces sp. G2]
MNDTTQPATIRVFIALAPPDDAKDELARALAPAYAAHPGMRWNRIEDWHITLAFLGELPVATVPLLHHPLAELAAARRPLDLSLRGGGHFDSRVLWSGIAGDVPGLHRLADDVRALVKEAGIPYEGRPLRPHLTLARARRGDLTGIPAASGVLDGFEGRSWPTARLHLVGSDYARGPAPVRYQDLVSWPFTGAGPGPGLRAR